MNWKLSMPPAALAPQFKDVYQQTPQVQNWIATPVRGFDWKVDMDAFSKLERLINEKWQLPYIAIQLMGPHQGQLWTSAYGWYDGDMTPITIWLHPFMTQNQANETLWHEIQHAYQDLEGRMDTKNYSPLSQEPEQYSEHPVEIDAEDFARQMSNVPLIEHAAPRVEPDWVPNDIHLDAGQWNEGKELYELSTDQLFEHVTAQVRMFRTDYSFWKSTWVGVGDDYSHWAKRATHVVKADYQGWTNWETWNTALMMDNEQDLYNHSRELAEKHLHNPEKGEKAIENWTVQHIIGPHNAQAIEDAKEWNSIPQEERLDPHYEEFKEKHPDSMDLLHGLVGGPDVGDSEPQIIDPNLVNWNEIFRHLTEEIDENVQYEREIQEKKNLGLGWPSNLPLEHNQMQDAFYRFHGATPEDETQGFNDPTAYHNIRVNIPFEHVQTGAGGYRWPDDYIEPATRVKMWNLFGNNYEKIPNIWEDPKAQEILREDPRAAEIMKNGFTTSLSDHFTNTISDIQHGRPNPYIDTMKQALEARGYTPEQIAEMMQQRWKWNPDTQEHIDLTKDYDKAPPIDKSLDQAGDLTLPENWSRIET